MPSQVSFFIIWMCSFGSDFSAHGIRFVCYRRDVACNIPTIYNVYFHCFTKYFSINRFVLKKIIYLL